MTMGYESRATTNLPDPRDARRVIDIRDQIRELQLQSSRAAAREEEATFFALPGRWTVAEFRDLLAAAA